MAFIYYIRMVYYFLRCKIFSFTEYIFYCLHFIVDIDECALGGHTCHAAQECENVIGSYRCVVRCGIGFRRTSDGLSCQGVQSSDLSSNELTLLLFKPCL